MTCFFDEPRWLVLHPKKKTNGWIPRKDGLEKVDLFKIWPFLVSILDFCCVIQKLRPSKQQKMRLESCCLGWGKRMGFSNLSPSINLLWCTTMIYDVIEFCRGLKGE